MLEGLVKHLQLVAAAEQAYAQVGAWPLRVAGSHSLGFVAVCAHSLAA